MAKRSTPLILLLLTFGTAAIAQKSDDEKKKQLDNLLQTTTDGEKVKFMTQYVLDSVFSKYQNTISGTQVQAGKLIGTSASITDKGATVNIGVAPIGKTYIQITVDGKGKDNFVSLFKEGQYGNTISVGAKVQAFGNGVGWFYPKNANLLKNQLHIINSQKYTSSIDREYDNKLAYIDTQIMNLTNGKAEYDLATDPKKSITDQQRIKARDFKIAADTLIKLGLLTKEFLDGKDLNQEISDINGRWSASTIQKEQRLKYYLKETEKLQVEAKWNQMRFTWVTFGLNYNVSNYNILDRSNAKKNYQNPHNNYYLSGSIAFNTLWIRNIKKETRYYISPTITVSNPEVYKDDMKVTLEKGDRIVTGQDTLILNSVHTELYKEKVKSKLSAALDLPFIFYNKKANVGFEFGIRLAVNDPKNDNVGLRAGLFIPVDVKEGTPILIEPIVRLEKLFSSGDHRLMKDNFVFGFNISVSVPKFLPN